jgi:hypothetical protein
MWTKFYDFKADNYDCKTSRKVPYQNWTMKLGTKHILQFKGLCYVAIPRDSDDVITYPLGRGLFVRKIRRKEGKKGKAGGKLHGHECSHSAV